MEEYIEYRGGEFEIKSIYWNSGEKIIFNIKKETEDLYFPDCYQGKAFKKISLAENYWNQKKFLKVRRIFIPAGIEKLEIANNTFPNLKEVVIDSENREYSTDGRMIFTDKGRSLYRCPVNGEGTLMIPKAVKKLQDQSLAYIGYAEIIFPESSFTVEGYDVLKDSRWLKNQTGTALAADLLLQAEPDENGRLEIPGSARRFCPGVFNFKERQKNWNYSLKEISCWSLPGTAALEELSKSTEGTELCIRSPKCRLDIHKLRKLGGLSYVTVPDSHEKYKSVNGVLFSKDGKTLIYYPPVKREAVYEMPAGTEQIGGLAFAGQRFLQEVYVADTVKRISTAAFYNCEELQNVKLPAELKELPDAGVYSAGGVFEGCSELKYIELPGKLRYMGSRCFYRSGLTGIALNKGLEMLGEYALYSEKLRSVCLPSSLRRVGKGALLNCEYVEAYEGTAKGLITAVNASEPGMRELAGNILWGSCTVQVLSGKEKFQYFRIPESIKKKEIYHLEQAWDHDGGIDWEEYDACFPHISDSEERLQMAADGIKRVKGDTESVYYEYLRHSAQRVGQRLITEHDENGFRIFLKQGFLSEAALSKLLKLSNKEGLTECSAYIMEQIRKNGRKQKGFRI